MARIMSVNETVAFINGREAEPGKRRSLGPRSFRKMVKDGSGPPRFDRIGQRDLFCDITVIPWMAERRVQIEDDA